MLNIKTFQVNMLGVNCYIVSDETCEAVVIDCGAYTQYEEQTLARYIESDGLTIKHFLCTHMHFDHIFGNAFIAETYGVKPKFHAADQPLYTTMPAQVMNFLGQSYHKALPVAETYLTENDVIKFGNHELSVIHIPGHSPGGLVFYCAEEKILFSGDSLFQYSIGRTDLPGGDYRTLIENLTTKVLTLPQDVVVYPGHGGTTTISNEIQSNPYL